MWLGKIEMLTCEVNNLIFITGTVIIVLGKKKGGSKCTHLSNGR